MKSVNKNFGYFVELPNCYYLVAVAQKPTKDFSPSKIAGFDSATYDFSLILFYSTDFLAEYEKANVILGKVDFLDDFFLKTAEIAKFKAMKRFSVVNSCYKKIMIAELTTKINAKKDNFTNKKAEFNKMEGKLGAILVDIKELEKANEELLNAENLDTKTFQQNALKIAKLKHSNKALIDNRNALFNECENLKSKIATLESELKELESV